MLGWVGCTNQVSGPLSVGCGIRLPLPTTVIPELYRMRHRTQVEHQVLRKLRNYLLLLIPAGLLAWLTFRLVDAVD